MGDKSDAGILYIVATPIGNLGDISKRAVEVLAGVDLVAAEDTRHTAGLLSHLGLRKKLLSVHAFNEQSRIQPVLEKLQQGASIALVSDAGTPLISDPGFPLVRAARAAGLVVSPIPGPSALIAALSVSGLPCERFVFEGFLPAKQGGRRSRLEALQNEERTIVFYESPHRIKDSIEDMVTVMGGERDAVLLRELTKIFEQIHADSLAGLHQWLLKDGDHRRGEFVVVLAGREVRLPGSSEQESIMKVLLGYMSVKDAAAAASQLTGVPRRQLYQLAVALKG